MSHLKIIKKISLIVSLLIFLVIELTSITLVNSDGYEKAYYLQIIAIACTLFLMFTYTKELMNEEEHVENGWTKLRKYTAYFFGFGVVSLIAFQITGVMSPQVGVKGYYGLGAYGLILGLMYGRNWKFHLLNGIVWMQGLSSIEWAITSVKNFLQVSAN